MEDHGGTGAEKQKRMGRPKVVDPTERRSTVIEHAYQAFIELGFAGTTTEIVATRARISKRAIYELFSGKADLFAAVVLNHRHLLLDSHPPVDKDTPIIEKLVKVFRLDMDRQHDIEREALLNLIRRESLQFPELSDLLYDQGIIRTREELMEWLESEAVGGTILVEDMAVCAGMLMDIVFGALLPQRRQLGDEARVLRKEHVKKRLEIFARGVLSISKKPDGSDF